MFKNKLGKDSPILKITYLKIQCRDGVESLTTIEEGEFKVPIDGYINSYQYCCMATVEEILHTFNLFQFKVCMTLSW